VTETKVDHVTAREAARALGISIDRVYKLIWEARLVGKKSPRGFWMVSRDSIETRAAWKGEVPKWE